MTARPTTRYAGCLAAAVLLLGATACSQDPNSVAAQARAGDQKGYVSGDGAVETIPEADRAEPVALSGDLVDGGSWDSASARGDVLVVNVWGSWCAPCVAEAPDLQQELNAAAGAALEALKRCGVALRGEIEPNPDPHAFAIGEEQFARRLHFEHAVVSGAPELWRYGLHLQEETTAQLAALQNTSVQLEQQRQAGIAAEEQRQREEANRRAAEAAAAAAAQKAAQEEAARVAAAAAAEAAARTARQERECGVQALE